MANGNGFPSGTCPDSEHISQERARLKSASQRHFAEGGRGGKAPAAPPKQVQATGSPNPGSRGAPNPSMGPSDLEDEM